MDSEAAPFGPLNLWHTREKDMITRIGKGRQTPERRGAELMAQRRFGLSDAVRPRPVIGYVVALAGTAALTAIFLPVRDSLTPVSEAFAYLVLVVAVAWIGGRWPGILASVLCFVAFNFFFLPPYGRFVIDRPEHVAVLFVLLGISLLISLMLGKTRERAEAAEMRENEVRALQELSGELVGRVPGKEAYEAVLQRLTSLLSVSAASLFVRDDESRSGLNEEVAVGVALGEIEPGTRSQAGGSSFERIPLSVGRHNLGMLILRGDGPPLSPGESRVLRAFCDQLALVLERDRLLRVAAKSETYRASEKLRRALLTAVSHDLRSPLSAIKASVTDLLDAGASVDDAYRHEVLASVDKEVDRLNILIANLLDMSRIETGMLRARIQSVDLEDVVAQAVEQARRRWPGVGFRASIEDRAALVMADPVFVDRVVTNLLDNAARSNVDVGADEIEVQARAHDDGSTIVRVIDHGRGVPSTVREHLFHPFYELDERSPRLGPGLGLAICKGFLVSMGGEVWVEETPGGGATFAFSLPAGAAAA